MERVRRRQGDSGRLGLKETVAAYLESLRRSGSLVGALFSCCEAPVKIFSLESFTLGSQDQVVAPELGFSVAKASLN